MPSVSDHRGGSDGPTPFALIGVGTGSDYKKWLFSSEAREAPKGSFTGAKAESEGKEFLWEEPLNVVVGSCGVVLAILELLRIEVRSDGAWLLSETLRTFAKVQLLVEVQALDDKLRPLFTLSSRWWTLPAGISDCIVIGGTNRSVAENFQKIHLWTRATNGWGPLS